MPRRIRLEARERYLQRIYELRREHRILRLTYERIRLHRVYTNVLLRIKSLSQRIHNAIAIAIDNAIRRSRLAYILRHKLLDYNTLLAVIHDYLLLTLSPEIRDEIIRYLRHFVYAKYVDERLLRENPILRYFVHRYITRYMRFPCKRNFYAIRLTPMIIRELWHYTFTFYILRHANITDVKADPYLGRTRNVDFYFTSSRRKADGELIGSSIVSDEGTLDYSEKIAIYVDDRRKPRLRVPIRRIVLQPHWVTYYYAKSSGQVDKVTVFGHCSLYAIPIRRSRTIRLRNVVTTSYELGRRKRHFAKTMTYWSRIRA